MKYGFLCALALIVTSGQAIAQSSDPWAGYEVRDIRQLHNQATQRRERLKDMAHKDYLRRQAAAYSLAPQTATPQAEPVRAPARSAGIQTSLRPVPKPVQTVVTSPWPGPFLDLSDDQRIDVMTSFPEPAPELVFGPEIVFENTVITASARPQVRPTPPKAEPALLLAGDAQSRGVTLTRYAEIPHTKAVRNPFRFVSVYDTYAVPSAGLRAEVNVSQQRMVLKDGGRVIAEWPVSTGRPGYESTRGEFKVSFLSRNHRSSQYDDAPMPCAVFYHNGEAFHGTNALSRLGSKASHGCVRLETVNACQLYDMVHERGKESLTVAVFD